MVSVDRWPFPEPRSFIALREAVELDPSVLQLADMPIGWHGFRDSPERPWTREAIDDAH
jgi:hypothetical protein